MDANAPRRGGSGGPRIGGTALVLAIAALVAIVAIASSGSAPSGGVTGRRPSEGLADTAFSLFIVLMAVGAVASVVLLSFFGRYTAEGDGRRRPKPWHGLVSFVVAMTLLVIVVRAFAKDGARAKILPPGSGSSGGARNPGPGAAYEPEFAVWPVLGVTACVLVALGAWWLTARGRRSARPALDPSPREALADVLAATLDDLRTEADPRRAVIGAYARMERSLASVGLARGPSEAPEEYLQRVLDDVAVSERAAGRLTALFAWARFSVHDVRPEMKDEAIETLERVQLELAAAEAEREARLAGALA